MKTIQANVPDKLYEDIQRLIQGGWFTNEEELLHEALRRYLETHRPNLMEQFIRQDIEWGLTGEN